jgi:hypothetical protein
MEYQPIKYVERVNGPFVIPAVQIEMIRFFNHARRWEISERVFDQIEGCIPDWPNEPMAAVVLVPYLPEKRGVRGHLRTFYELWNIAADRQEKSLKWDGFDLAATNPLRLIDGIRHTPGLRWEIIQLAENRNQRATDVRTPQFTPHAGILAAAALHPQWVRAINGEDVPHVLLSGYEVTVRKTASWGHAPMLSYQIHEGAIELEPVETHRHSYSCAVPTFYVPPMAVITNP